ncbi:hypothetical protein N5C38_08620 [Pseudomonas chengduensis]|nr:hypothetical protein [Pseudomonas chengduensis]MDH1211117.1 hypothetical protein [Pseudomonas chengduensis]
MDIQVEGSNNRVAGRDYYEIDIESPASQLWLMSDEELGAERLRCERKKAQAKRRMRPTGLVLVMLFCTIGLFGTISLLKPALFSGLVAAAWAIALTAVMIPFQRNADFERYALNHYQDRLRVIDLVRRDREPVHDEHGGV